MLFAGLARHAILADAPAPPQAQRTRSAGRRLADSLGSHCTTLEGDAEPTASCWICAAIYMFVLGMIVRDPLAPRPQRIHLAKLRNDLFLYAYILPRISCSMAKPDLRTTTVAERGFRSKLICITARAKKKVGPQNAAPFADNPAPLHSNRPKNSPPDRRSTAYRKGGTHWILYLWNIAGLTGSSGAQRR
jgi:hypothetical protein